MDPVQLTQLTAGINQSNERGGSEPGGSLLSAKEAATSCPQVPGERTAHSRGDGR